ncbi:testis-expressed protein 15 isoform X3 [Ascaphus truei]|uniref:testis-expressed protein 15 isoform X3 n=1 Tax=Ascaphus truei TaxID=8439 RepID=UPI003F5A669F
MLRSLQELSNTENCECCGSKIYFTTEETEEDISHHAVKSHSGLKLRLCGTWIKFGVPLDDNKMEESVKSCSAVSRVGSKPLKNFTIPKIRRAADIVYLAGCLTDTREYREIQIAVKEARLNIGCELQTSWKFGEINLIFNDDLKKKYAAKRSEMREEGRQLQEHFCFLVLPRSAIMNIYQHGLHVDGTASTALGNPLRGICVFRHIDVALNFAKQTDSKSDYIMVFKVLFGKVKKVQAIGNSKGKVAMDPTPNFDCHVSRKAPSPKDSSDEQTINSLVYLYEYDNSLRPVETPRHCLPYALMAVRFVGHQARTAPSISLLRYQPKPFSSGKDHLTNCTVAKRIGKGKDATIVFESIRTPVEPTPSAQEMSLCTSLYCAQNQGSALSTTGTDQKSATIKSWGNIVPHGTKEANINIHERATDVESLITPSMVITSKSIKDPRLLKRDEENISKPNDQPVTSYLKHVQQAKIQTEACDELISAQSNFSNDNEQCVTGKKLPICDIEKYNSSSTNKSRDSHDIKRSVNESFEEARLSEDLQMKKKCKKYSSFFVLSDRDRKAQIASLKSLSKDDKAQLSHRLYMYEKYYKKYAKPLGCENKRKPEYSHKSSTGGTFSGCQEDVSIKTMSITNSTCRSFAPKVLQSTNQFKTQNKCNAVMIKKVPATKGTCISRENNQKKNEERTQASQCVSKERRQYHKPTQNKKQHDCKSENFRHGSASPRSHSIKNSKGHQTLSVTTSKSTAVIKDQNNLTKIPRKAHTPEIKTVNSHRQQCEGLDMDKSRTESETNQSIKVVVDAKSAEIVPAENDAISTKAITSRENDYIKDTGDLLHPSNSKISKATVSVHGKIKPQKVTLGENGRLKKTLSNYQTKGCKPGLHKQKVDTEERKKVHVFPRSKQSTLANKQRDVNITEARVLAKKSAVCAKPISCVKKRTKSWLHSSGTVLNSINNKETKKKETSERNLPCAEEQLNDLIFQDMVPNEKLQKSDENSVQCITLTNEEILCPHNRLENNNSELCNIPKDNFVTKEITSDSNLTYFVEGAFSERIRCLKERTNPMHNKESKSGKMKENKLVVYPVEKKICSTHVQEDPVCQNQNASICTPETKIANQPCPPNDISVYNSEHFDDSLESKTSNSTSPIQNNESDIHNDKDIFLQNMEHQNEIEIPSTKNLSKQDSLVQTNSYTVGNMSDKTLSYDCLLENRIDWKSLFGIEGTEAMIGEVTNHSICTENGCPLYSYKARGKKEPGGMRVFPDLQVTISTVNNPCIDYSLELFSETPTCLVGQLNPHMEGKKLLKIKSEKEIDAFRGCQVSKEVQITDNGLQVTKSAGYQHQIAFLTSQNDNTNKDETTNEESKRYSSKYSAKVGDTKRPDDKTCKTSSEITSVAITDIRKINGKQENGTPVQKQTHSNVKKRRLSNKSSAGVLAKSAGRIKKFSQSEKNIKSVLSMLSDEVPLCKSKRISKKLDRAILHLRKAHKRVQRSLQLVAKVGEKRKAFLPKPHNMLGRNMWGKNNIESCNAIVTIPPCGEVKPTANDIRIMQNDADIHKLSSQDLHMLNSCKKAVDPDEMQRKSVPLSRECLTMSTQVLEGISKQDCQHAKSTAISPAHSPCSLGATYLSASDNNAVSPSAASHDHKHFSEFIQTNKENACPPVTLKKGAENIKRKICIEYESDLSVQCCSPTASIITDSLEAFDAVEQKHVSTLPKVSSISQSKPIGLSHTKSSTEGKSLPVICHSASQTKQLHGNSMQDSNVNVPHYGDQLSREGKIVRTNQSAPLKIECDKRSTSLVTELSKILQKADETCSLKALQEFRLICKKMLPTFITVFEKKQQCSFKEVMVDRKLLVDRNIKISFKHVLKPQAIESCVELQMVMETIQYIENKIRYFEGEPTFRSLLWYDSSLYTELLGGETGYQQQSPFYTAFQEKLKHSALSTLENHHTQLCEFLEGIHEINSSYYIFLKYRREIEECEAVVQNRSDCLSFSLSVPFTCGVHIGDTLDDLEALQKSTVELIKTYVHLPKCDSGKQEHALCLLEVISAKIDLIKTTVTINIQLSLFGLEHLLFDAAKTLVLKKKRQRARQKREPKLTSVCLLKINHQALTKLYVIYGTTNKIGVQKAEDLLQTNNDLNKDVQPQKKVCYVGKIIDQARCADPLVLQKIILDHKKQLNILIKYFQILQECDADIAIITENNVLEATKRQDQTAILLKPEAVETYIELLMTFEILNFLNSLLASKINQKSFRGLLWFDNSLLPELVHCQNRMASHLKGDLKANAIDVIDGTISELKSELEIIGDYTNSVNYSYALQIMTRELSELSELKSVLSKTKSAITTYIDFSPYIVSANYGSTAMELEYNYNQLSEFLGLLMLAPKKDLGKMAHTMKIMKTIECMKSGTFNLGKSTFNLLVCQILENKKKRDQELANNQEAEEEPSEEYIKYNANNDYINKTLTDQSPRKRTDTQSSKDLGGHKVYLSPKKQKAINSPKINSTIKQEENRLQSKVRMKAIDAQSTKEDTHLKDSVSSVVKDCKSPLNVPMEKCVSPLTKTPGLDCSSQDDVRIKEHRGHVLSSTEGSKIQRREYGLHSKEIPSAEKLKNFSDFSLKFTTPGSVKTSSNVSTSGMHRSALPVDNGHLYPKHQVQVQDEKDVHPSSESRFSSAKKNVGVTSQAAMVQNEENKTTLKIGLSVDQKKSHNVHFVDKYSKASAPSQAQKSKIPVFPVTEAKAQEKDESSFHSDQPVQHNSGSNDCNSAPSWAVAQMSSTYAQPPDPVYPWNSSSYFWYQNSSNSVVTQTYQGISSDRQQIVPYGGPSAFLIQNSFATNQSYSNYANSMQPQMFSTPGSFNADSWQ